MPAVAALAQLKFSITMILGPALAGFLLAKYNVAFVYALDACTYIISLITVFLINAPLITQKATKSVWQSIKQGLRYAASRQELMGTYLIDFVAMVFGMPLALFPAIAKSFASVSAIGWLYAGPSLGLFLAAIFSGWTHKIDRHGVAIAIAATIWGLAIIAFGLASNLYLAVLFLALAGAADAVSGLFRTTMWNQTIPQHLRGRLAGIEMISYMSGPLLGNAEAGLMAAAAGTTFSVISGGVLCVVAVVVLLFALPKFKNYSAKNYKPLESAL
jgi:MFS family permease